MVSVIDYFPSKLAKSPSFCNRLAERELLTRNIHLGRHTVLISPRRYGKSSLAHEVIVNLTLPFASIDLFLAHDGKAITKRILDGISHAINQMIPVTQKALIGIQGYFGHFKIILEASGFSLQATHESSVIDPAEQIFDSLKSLSRLAVDKKKKVILFIDEFQDIASAENSKSIQGAIRHIGQETENIIFVFSGSNRHLLLELFDDNSKPLYMLCDKILLDRMSSADYEPYIQEAAQAKWKVPISEMMLEKILVLTELHPFYVNLLCNEIWKNNKMPKAEIVHQAWAACYETEERRLISELEKLTKNQQDILKALAFMPTQESNSRKFLNEARLSLSSVRAGIKSLLEKDMIYQVKREDVKLPDMKKDQLRVLDPLLAYALKKYN